MLWKLKSTETFKNNKLNDNEKEIVVTLIKDYTDKIYVPQDNR